MSWILKCFNSIWGTWLELSPWLMVGLIAAGTIYVFFPARKIRKMIGGRGLVSVLKTALLGVPVPLCSCSVIPTAMAIRRRGASKGATSAFLISTPETGIDSIAVTWAVMDPLMTIARPIAALITAVTCGWLQDLWPDDGTGVEKIGDDEQCHLCMQSVLDGHVHGLSEKISQVFSFGFGDMLLDIGKWLLIGVVIAGVLTTWLSPEWVSANLSQGWHPKLLMLLIGIPLYICASASTPIAASLVVLGVSPGTAMILLLVGPATNIATLGVVSRFLGKRSAVLYLTSLIVMSLAAAWAVDGLYAYWNMTPAFQIAQPDMHGGWWWMAEWSSAAILLTTLSVLVIKKHLRAANHTESGHNHASCCESDSQSGDSDTTTVHTHESERTSLASHSTGERNSG